MKKSNKAALLLLSVALFLSSCSASPSSELIVPKNNERLIEKANDTNDENRKKLSELNGENYTFSFTSSDGNVAINADADVVLPNADTVPMYRVVPAGFTQEQATAAFNLLIGDKKAWRYPENASFEKSVYDADIKELEKQIESIRQDADKDKEEIERYVAAYEYEIEELKKARDNAPDTVEKIPVDGTFYTATTNTVEGERQYRCLVARTDDGCELSIRNYCDYGDASFTALRYTKSDSKEYYPIDDDVSTCQCKYSVDEASGFASELMQTMGVKAHTVRIGLVCSEFSNEGKPLEKAYAFYMTRVINDVPVAATTCSLIYHDSTAKPWLYEKILVCVDDNGICYVFWENPVEQNQTVADDVHIVPFSSAAEIFEQMSPLIWQGNLVETMKTSLYDTKYRIEVSRIELNLVRVRDSGDLSGIYTPAYVFYGKQTTIRTDPRNNETFEDTETEPWIIMAINAVDLSVIDIIAGY